MEACGAAAGGNTGTGLLPILLTTEGLLFAALSISVGLAARSTFGPRTVLPPAALAYVAAVVLATVAAAAVLAWTDLFGGDCWPGGWNLRLESLALLFAIVVQPLIALLIALGLSRG